MASLGDREVEGNKTKTKKPSQEGLGEWGGTGGMGRALVMGRDWENGGSKWVYLKFSFSLFRCM